jgi:hypothetical protein
VGKEDNHFERGRRQFRIRLPRFGLHHIPRRPTLLNRHATLYGVDCLRLHKNRSRLSFDCAEQNYIGTTGLDPVVHADLSDGRRGRIDCRIKSGNGRATSAPAKRGRGTARSAVEGAYRAPSILLTVERAPLPRPFHHAAAQRGPPSPLARGRKSSAVTTAASTRAARPRPAL